MSHRHLLGALATFASLVVAATGCSGGHTEAALTLSPASAVVPPRGTAAFTAAGGSGGYAWSLATNASGGTIDAASGAYRAGSTGGVADLVQVTDASGKVATASVTVTAGVTITPASAAVPPRGAQAFAAAGGSGAGFTWSLATNASGGTIDAGTGAYAAGATGGVTDVVSVTDSLGNTASRQVVVGPAVSITPSVAGLAPRGTQAFTAAGGSGTGFTWTLTTSGSGAATINATTGAYQAGAAQGTDVVQVADSLGNTATVSVTVTAGLSITASATTTAPRGQLAFTAAGGSGTGYAWSLATNASGGSIAGATGAYTAGSTGGVTDIIRLTDSLGNTTTRNVSVTAGVSIAPASASAPPRGAVAFTASGGSGTGFTWSLATNASGGSINSSTGAYLAGGTGGVTDVVQVTDSLGNTATRSVSVAAGILISPTTASVAPRGTLVFSALGGSGVYTFSLATAASGGTIDSSTGAYQAGSTGGVTDVVRVTDSLGNVATRNVSVTAGIAISPATASVAPRGAQAFTASGGGGAGFTWSLATNASGGTISSTGAYLAGATGSVTDVVRVTDLLGNTATRDVAVGPGVSIAPATVTVAPRGSQAFTGAGGNGVFTWSLSTNGSGGSIVASTGAYTAGATGDTTDVVTLADALGNTATRTVTVTAAVSIAGSTGLAPRASATLTASGGSGTGFTWSIPTNNSGGSITAGGVYTAGTTGSVTDVVQVTDDLGNVATHNVAVSAGVSITPGSVSVDPAGTQTFTASGGSGSGYTWTLPTHPSGGSIVGGTGAYTAGTTGGVTDVVRVTDALGNTATANVIVRGVVLQRWTTPAAWGGNATSFWTSDASTLEHATFGATGLPVETGTAGVTWSLVGPGSVPHASFTGFAWPVATRYGAGPFPGTDDLVTNDATRFQASGHDAALDLTGDMLACAVVRPDVNPIDDGYERIILSKGFQDTNGWVLMQRHHTFSFFYQGAVSGGIWPYVLTHVPDNNDRNGPGPGEISYMVVCAGRAGDNLVLSINGTVEIETGSSSQSLTPGEAVVPATGVPLTIGGYSSGKGSSRYGGNVYETAVWNIPATAANIQAKTAAVLGLALPDGTLATYKRNHEGPQLGPDGNYHTQWRHGPRIDPTKGFEFGLWGQNGVVNNVVPGGNGGVLPGALGLWTAAGGATVDPNVRAQPGESIVATADRVVLPTGSSISAPLVSYPPLPSGLTSAALSGQIWFYIDTVTGTDTTSGTLRVRTTVPASGGGPDVEMGHFDINLANVTPNQWSRVFIPPVDGAGPHLTTDGSQTVPGKLFLENLGAPIKFVAWGVDVAEVGGARGLPLGFDPGLGMYDSMTGSDLGEFLELPPVPASSAGGGLCVAADAQPAAGLGWSTNFDDLRSIFAWSNGKSGAQERLVRLVIGGDPSISVVQGDLVARVVVDGVAVFTHGTPPGWTAGSKHNVKICVSAAGDVQIYGDDVAIGPSFNLGAGVPVPDLAAGSIYVGNDNTGVVPWYGWISQALACRYTGDPSVCH